MHMYIAAIDALPPVGDPEFAERAAVVLSGLRKLQTSLSEAAGRSRVTPSVIVALSGVRHRYDELMTIASKAPAPRSASVCMSRAAGPSCPPRKPPTASACART